MAKVSIVLPTYNGARYLREAIDSILAQTLRDWELWIVDDCSTDESGAIAEEYSEKDSRIHVFHNETNRKLPGALNAGFRRVGGSDYLTWTSDDNILHPTMLQELSGWLDSHQETVMVCGQIRVVNDEKEFLRLNPPYSDEAMLVGNFVGASFMYRRCVLDDVGFYDEELFCIEDYDYWIRILRRYGHIDWLETPLYDYRWHASSLTQAKWKQVAAMYTELRHRNFQWIMDGLERRPQDICRIYFEMRQYGGVTKDEEAYFFEKLPYLRAYKPIEQIPEDTKLICWGAGQVGQQVAQFYAQRIVCFVDKNEARQGTKWMKFSIQPLDVIKKHKDNEIILLTVGAEKIYSCLECLKEWSVEKFSVFYGKPVF